MLSLQLHFISWVIDLFSARGRAGEGQGAGDRGSQQAPGGRHAAEPDSGWIPRAVSTCPTSLSGPGPHSHSGGPGQAGRGAPAGPAVLAGVVGGWACGPGSRVRWDGDPTAPRADRFPSAVTCSHVPCLDGARSDDAPAWSGRAVHLWREQQTSRSAEEQPPSPQGVVSSPCGLILRGRA